MGQITSDTFICFDLETTGLDPVNDRIIEIAIVKFTLDGFVESFETLVDPEKQITISLKIWLRENQKFKRFYPIF